MKIFRHLFVMFGLFASGILTPFLSTGQTMTQWDILPQDTSDYYFNISFTVTNIVGCNCPATQDLIQVYPCFNCPSQAVTVASRTASLNNYTGKTGNAIGGPAYGPNVSQLWVGRFINDGWSPGFFGDCDNVCMIDVKGSTFSTKPVFKVKDVTATGRVDGFVALSWTVATHIPQNAYKLEIRENGVLRFETTDKSVTSAQIGWYGRLEEPVFEIKTIYTPDPTKFSIVTTNPVFMPDPQGSISGKITTKPPANAPVAGVNVTAVLQNPQDLTNGTFVVQSHTTTTDSEGDYVIPFLYFGTGSQQAVWKVTPSFDNKAFDPEFANKTLVPGNFIQTQNFKDTTSFVISGNVRSLFGNNCGLDGVLIQQAPPGNSGIIPVLTDADGNYTLVIPNAGTYSLKANFPIKNPANDTIISNIVVNNNVSNQNFLHKAKDTLRGFIGASCNEFIGIADIDIKTPAGCVVASISTNNSGYYEIVVASRELIVEVTNFTAAPGSGLDPLDVLASIADPVNITVDKTTTLNFIYRRPLTIQLIGIPKPSCVDRPFGVVKQGRQIPVLIRVWEKLNVCPADTGYIIITDNVSGTVQQNTKIDTVFIENGQAIYMMTPGVPSLVEPHTKSISFIAYVGSRISQPVSRSLIVTGSRQRGATFTTNAPTKLPTLILRDPPGDGSYSFLEESNKVRYAQSFSTSNGGGVKIWLKAKAGIEIFSLKIWGQIGGSFQIDATGATNEEVIVEVTNTSSYSTSSLPDVIGDSGDLIMGAATNFIYSLADEISFDLATCSINKDTVLMFGPDNFETTFIYSQNYIRNVVIPTLRFFIASDPNNAQMVSRWENEIFVWEQTLQLNADLKRAGLQNSQNFSFDGDIGTFGFTNTGTSTQSRTIEFKTTIDIQIAAEAGFEIGGSGASAGVDVNFRTTFGNKEIFENTTTTTTGFYINDDDSFDALSFDVGTDPVYGTAVFGNVVGQTSCPHEPGTLQRDVPTIVVDNPTEVVPSGNDAYFFMRLGNISESDEDRTYVLSLNAATTQGAEVFLGSNNFSNPIPFVMGVGGETDIVIRVSRPNGFPGYAFEGIEFSFYPICDPSIVQRAYISAYFPNNCSPVVLQEPEDNWIVNQTNNNILPIRINGYNIPTSGIERVILQYSKVGTSSWTSTNINLMGSALSNGPNGTLVNWVVPTTLADGKYRIRLRLKCFNNSAFNYSARVEGTIDRKAPVVFGKEEPTDDNFELGDEIAVYFNEQIKCEQLSGANLTFKMIPQNVIIPATLNCDGNKVTIHPAQNISTLLNQAAMVEITQIQDMFNNMRPDTVRWTFVIGDPDSDGDGISDSKDRCPGYDDFIDSDLGGLPDGCDCLPDNPANDALEFDCVGCPFTEKNTVLHFNGQGEQVYITNIIQTESVFYNTTNSFTYEFWVKPEKTIPNGLLESNSGTSTYTTTSDFPAVISAWPSQSLYGNTRVTAGVAVGTNGIVVNEMGLNHSPLTLIHYTPINDWTHIAIVYLNKQPRLYINGQLIKNGQTSVANFVHPTGAIGSQFSSANHNKFKGLLDNVRLWNVARSQSQILSRMHKEGVASDNNLIMSYNFSDGTPGGNNQNISQIIDASSYNQNTVLSNFNLVGGISNFVSGKSLTSSDTIYRTNTVMDFDGVNDYLSFSEGNLASISNSFTYEFYVKPEKTIPEGISQNPFAISDFNNESEWPVVFAPLTGLNNVNASVGIAVGTNGIVVLEKTSENAYNRLVYYDNIPDWTHIALVYDQLAPKLYKNGVLIASSTPLLMETVRPSSFIGSSGDSNYFQGQLDEVKIWNSARTQTQILDDMFYPVNGPTQELKLYYDFEEGIANGNNLSRVQISDNSNSGNNGTIHNFTLAGDMSNYVFGPLLIFQDSDRNGIADGCCKQILVLTKDDSPLRGTYIAGTEIRILEGLMVLDGHNAIFKAPLVTVPQSNNNNNFANLILASGSNIVVDPNGCMD